MVPFPSPAVNREPDLPTDPIPSDAQIDVLVINLQLGWTDNDPDGDAVTYHVFFGTQPGSMTEVAIFQDQTSFSYPDTLAFNTRYFWQIIAEDAHGAGTEGPLWTFVTELEPLPADSSDSLATKMSSR